jgi:hypothetical protein
MGQSGTRKLVVKRGARNAVTCCCRGIKESVFSLKMQNLDIMKPK